MIAAEMYEIMYSCIDLFFLVLVKVNGIVHVRAYCYHHAKYLPFMRPSYWTELHILLYPLPMNGLITFAGSGTCKQT